MRVIKTTNGYSVLVDDEDFDKINQYRWHAGRKRANGPLYVYTGIRYFGKRYVLHRLVMNAPDNMVVDHINHNTLDNQKNNLRVVTQQANIMNQKMSKKNTSGYKGVTWDKNRNKWVAQIKLQQRNIHLGRYIKIEDAIIARKQAEEKYFGEYAYKEDLCQ